MAEFSGGGSDIGDLIRKLEQADLFTAEMQEQLIDTGAENLMQTIREEAGRSRFNLGHLLQKLSKTRKMKIEKDGSSYKNVTVAGKQKNGQRLAAIFFVLNYGRSKKYGEIPGGYFWTRAVQRAEKTNVLKMEEKVTEHLKEKGLI